ncbi:MAG: ABC transporter permease [Eubacteriales bacterium]|nr:ABC transporter permease [Eubacteriales bacterium]
MSTSKFAFAGRRSLAQEETAQPVSSIKETLVIFSKNKGAVAAAVIILVLVILAVIGPHLNQYTYDYVQIDRQNLPPRIPGLEKLGIFDGTLKGVNMYEAKGCLEEYYWFGTDSLGRDLFTRLWQGTRISLIVAVVSALLDLLIGVTYGLISGYYGGRLDLIMQRITEVIHSIPSLVVVSLLIIVIHPGLFSIILAMTISGWIDMSRLVRANTLRLKASEHILASRTLGTKIPVILFREIFPNLLNSVIVMAMMSIPTAIFTESFLSFVGLGIPAPQASLGSLINDGYGKMTIYPYQAAIPVVVFALLMISLNLAGDGLRDALDPKQKRM